MPKVFNREKAKADGWSDAEIDSFLQKQQGTTPAPTSQPVAPPTPTVPEDEGGLRKMLLSFLPTAGAVIGGGLMGAAGSIVPGAGTVAGGLAGAGLGAGGGEWLRQKLEGENTDAGKIAFEGGLGAVSGPVGKVALKVAGKAVGPAGKVIKEVIPEGLMNSAFKEGKRQTESAIKKGVTLGKEALDKGVKGKRSKQVLNEAEKAINTAEDALQNLLNSDQAKNLFMSKSDLLKHAGPVIEDMRRVANPQAKVLTDRIDDMIKINGDQIPLKVANKMKRSLYDEVHKAYGTQAQPGTEGIKTIAKGIKEALEVVPGVKELNKDLSFWGRISDSMVDKMAKPGMGFMDNIGAIVGITGAPGTGGASLAVPAAQLLMKSTGAKTYAANTLKSIGEMTDVLGKKMVDSPTINRVVGGTALKVPSIPGGEKVGDDNYNTTNNNVNHNNSTITPPVNNSIEEEQEPLISEEEMALLLLTDARDGGKNTAALKAIWDIVKPDDAAGKPPTEKQKLFAASAAGAREALSMLDNNQVKIGPIQGRVEQFKSGVTGTTSEEQQMYMSKIALVRSAILNAYLGGAIPPQEYKRMEDAIPQATDPTPTAKAKLKNFITELERFSVGEVQPSGLPSVSDAASLLGK